MTEPEKKFQCQNCYEFFDEEELVAMYECNSCGTIFSQDNSADGFSNRCPQCNKFAAKLHEHGCPNCEDEAECEEVQAVKDEETGEWVLVEPAKPAEPVAPSTHYHLKFTHKNGEIHINDEALYLTEKDARDWIEWQPGYVERNEDGSYTVIKKVVYALSHNPTVKVDVVECTQKHDKRTRVMQNPSEVR